jgi:hypothetical protein
MKVLHERVAGTGVHKDMIKVAVRSPGQKAWTRKTDVLTYGTFYGVLREMGRELLRREVTHVVMEASGTCTDPVRDALLEAGGVHRGDGDQPGAREGAEGAQDRRPGLRAAGRAAGVRAAAGQLPPVPGAKGGAGPDQVPGQDSSWLQALLT